MKLRVITPIVPEGGQAEVARDDRLFSAAAPGTELQHVYIQDGPPSIESDYEDAIAVPATVEAAKQAERDGVDAIVINCTADTGLAACRENVSIPVIAPTLSAMHLAAQLSHRFSVLTFTDRINQRFEEMAWRWGFHHKLASVLSVEISFEEMANDFEALARDLFEAGMRCYREDGAHCLIMGCTDFENVTDEVQRLFDEAGVPMLIIRPYLVAVRQAEALASMNLGHSKLTYPKPKV